MLSDTLLDELRKKSGTSVRIVVGKCHDVPDVDPTQSSHYGHTCSGSQIIMNNRNPVTSKDLSAEKLRTALWRDMAQRDVPAERDLHDYPILCNNTNSPWKAAKLLISVGFEDPLREQPP